MDANQEFTATALERLRHASDAWYRSDPSPTVPCGRGVSRSAPWGRWGPCTAGWPQVEATVQPMAARFSDPDMTTDLEVVQVGSELASTVGDEHGQLAIDGNRQPVRIRATHIDRRAQEEWTLIHRHGDLAPVDATPSIPMTSSGRAR